MAALRAIRPVAMPLSFAVLLAILVNPLRNWLNKRVQRWLSLIMILALLLAVLGIFGGALLLSAEQLEPQLPDYVERLQQLWQTLSTYLGNWGISVDASLLQNSSAWQNIFEAGSWQRSSGFRKFESVHFGCLFAGTAAARS